MPTLAGPAHGYPVSWQQCRVLWGSDIKYGAFLSTLGCCLALSSASKVTKPELGVLQEGISRPTGLRVTPPLTAGLSLTTLRTSSLSFPHPLLPFGSRSCLWWTPEGGSFCPAVSLSDPDSVICRF